MNRSGFDEQNRRKPFRLWETDKPGSDQDFKDLVNKMTNFDLAKRISARDALQHKQFADVEN